MMERKSKFFLFELLILVFLASIILYMNSSGERIAVTEFAPERIQAQKDLIAERLNVNADDYNVFYVTGCPGCYAQINYASKTIFIDTEHHSNEQEILQSLTHELTHLKLYKYRLIFTIFFFTLWAILSFTYFKKDIIKILILAGIIFMLRIEADEILPNLYAKSYEMVTYDVLSVLSLIAGVVIMVYTIKVMQCKKNPA